MNVNDKAPDFTLQDQDGKDLSLKDLRGKVSSSCFSFRGPIHRVERLKLAGSATHTKRCRSRAPCCLAVSPDTPKAQKKFQEKFDLPFTLLADVEKKVAGAFGVMKEKNMYGKKVMGVARTTFIIGPDGKIRHIFEKVKPEGHAEEVLAYLKESAEGRRRGTE